MTNEDLHKRYYVKFAAEFARADFYPCLNSVSDEDAIRAALDAEVDIHMFKRSPRRLPRIVKTIGILRQMNPSSLLECGCGQGVFLWTLLDVFPDLEITAVDCNETHVSRIEKVTKNSAFKLSGQFAELDKPEKWETFSPLYDVVTCLEVLEHISEWQKAVEFICQCSKKFVIVSFPSKPDDNPEHIHLFDKQKVANEFMKQKNVIGTKFDYVNGHIFVIAHKKDNPF